MVLLHQALAAQKLTVAQEGQEILSVQPQAAAALRAVQVMLVALVAPGMAPPVIQDTAVVAVPIVRQTVVLELRLQAAMAVMAPGVVGAALAPLHLLAQHLARQIQAAVAEGAFQT